MVENRKFEQLLALHCAPTLAGIKGGNLITVQKRKINDFFSLLQEYENCLNCKGIFFEVLSESPHYFLVLVYRKTVLLQILEQPQNRNLLLSLGYRQSDGIDECLVYLKIRMQLKKTFPHEIGLFLGYPYADVIGFIENKGQKFKLCGYWKVYSDIHVAEKLFDRYTKCSDIFCRRINNGTSIIELARVV